MLKKKNIYVIAISVIIAFLVIISSFLGFMLYLQWRQFNLASSYYENIARMDTLAYAKNIEVTSLKVGFSFNNIPYVAAKIKNTGKKTVISIMLKLNFLDSAGKVVHTCVIYPLEPFRPPNFFKNVHLDHLGFVKELYIKGGKEILFKSMLWRLPAKIAKMAKRNSFSSKPGEWCGKIEAKVMQLRLSLT